MWSRSVTSWRLLWATWKRGTKGEDEMNVVVAVAQFLVNEVLSKPFYLVGLMTALGLVALRRPAGEVVSGALKATMGFLILGVGANTVVAALTPLGTLILGAVSAQGVVPTNE